MRSWNGSPVSGPERQGYIQGFIAAKMRERIYSEQAEAMARSRAHAKAMDKVLPRLVRKLKFVLWATRGQGRPFQFLLWLLFDKATVRLLRYEFRWR